MQATCRCLLSPDLLYRPHVGVNLHLIILYRPHVGVSFHLIILYRPVEVAAATVAMATPLVMQTMQWVSQLLRPEPLLTSYWPVKSTLKIA